MREAVVENEFVKAVQKAGGVAYKLTSQTTNGLPDRLVLFFPAKTVFAELKAPGKMLRPLQRKRRYQLQKLGFPVLCIDRLSQIKPAIRAIVDWTPGEPFPEGIGAAVPELEVATLAAIPGSPESLADPDDFGETLYALWRFKGVVLERRKALAQDALLVSHCVEHVHRVCRRYKLVHCLFYSAVC